MIYLELFLSFLQIGAFSFGGGYGAIPLIQEQVVLQHGWLTQGVFTDLVTIAEMTPGPIAVNAATFVGTQIGGPLGALAATGGCILPSCVFVTALAYIYTKFRKFSLLQGVLNSLRPAVVAVIAKAGITLMVSAFLVQGTFASPPVFGTVFSAGNVKYRCVAYFAAALYLLRKKHFNPVFVMAMCGLAEAAVYGISLFV